MTARRLGRSRRARTTNARSAPLQGGNSDKDNAGDGAGDIEFALAHGLVLLFADAAHDALEEVQRLRREAANRANVVGGFGLELLQVVERVGVEGSVLGLDLQRVGEGAQR